MNNARSYSDINTYQRCPKQYQYRVVWGIERKKLAIDLFRGIEAHEYLKMFFLSIQRGLSVDEAWLLVHSYAHERINSFREVMLDNEMADARKEAEVILSIIERYCKRYAQDWEILHVEEEFYFELGNGEVISFTPDLVVRDRNGSIWIIDHKTTSRGVEEGVPFGDMQALLYYAGVKALYPECKGFIFNRIRKKIPSTPRLTKKGTPKVAYLKTIDTTYEILLEFLKTEAPFLLNDLDHRRRLAQLRDQGDRFFWTENVFVNEDTVMNVLADVEFVTLQIKHSEDTNRFPRHLLQSNGYKDCQKCPYQRLCHAEMVGWDTVDLINEDFQARGPKNEYEGEDDGQD